MGCNFEELNVWKEACSLAVAVYKTVQDCKDFALKDQIQRVAVSIPSNIAEGTERQSGKEFIYFLFIAKGSAAELRTQLYIAVSIGMISQEAAEQLIEITKKISSMLQKLISFQKTKL